MRASRTVKFWTGHAAITPLADHPAVRSSANRLRISDQAFHGWYRFVLSFPAHLVSAYLEKLGAEPGRDRVLDPFCGTGTTLVEAKKLGYESIGVEANPVPALAARVKTDWTLDGDVLEETAQRVIRSTEGDHEEAKLPSSNGGPLFVRRDGSCKAWIPPESILGLIPRGMMSPLPLRRVLMLRDRIEAVRNIRVRDTLRVALAACLVEDIGNVGFGPEIYTTKPKADAPVLDVFRRKVARMAADLREVSDDEWPESVVHLDDARTLASLPDRSVDAVVTSPPYPNEKDYTRATRLETVLLGFVNDREQLRLLKRGLLRSNSRGVYRDDRDDVLVEGFRRITDLARRIEARRVALGKDSGFERTYPRVVLLYFGGMCRHLASLKRVLRPGARLAYVVGDQMSFLMVPIQTGSLLAEIAESIGYEVEGIDLWRTRLATTSGVNLREEAVRLRLP